MCKLKFLTTMKKIKLLLLASTITISTVACSSSSQSAAPLGKEEKNAVYASVSWLDQEVGFVENEKLNYFLNVTLLARLKTGAARSVKSEQERYNLNNLNWQVYVLDTSQRNAFSIGDGTIILTRGLIMSLKTDSEIASIVAHEMSHQIIGDTRKALDESISGKKPQAFFFSLEEEIEADKLTLSILHNANYIANATLKAFPLAYRPESESFSGKNADVNNSIMNERLNAIVELLQKSGLSNLMPKKDKSSEFAQAKKGLKS